MSRRFAALLLCMLAMGPVAALAQSWGNVATESGLTSTTICNTDGTDITCDLPNPQVLSGGVISATGVSTTYISTTYMQISSATEVLTCGAGMTGAMRYTSGTMQVCDGAEWGNIGIGVPTGTIVAFSASSCPAGWGEYTPARGRFLRGIDTLAAGIDPDGTRAPGDTQDDQFKSHTHTYGVTQAIAGGGGNLRNYATGSTFATGATGGDETRPKNVAVIFCQYAGYDSSMAVGVASLASLSDVSVGSASNGDALVYDDGTWVPGTGSAGTTAGGSDTQVQFNNGGTDLGGSENFTWNEGFDFLTVAGSASITNLYATTLEAGNGYIPILAGGISAFNSVSSTVVSATNISTTYIQLNSPTEVLACGAGMTGAMRYTSGTMQVCDGLEWGNVGIGVPTGTIAAFAASSCPNGWSEYTPARGRFLRGIDTLAAGIDPDGTRTPGNLQADELKSHRHEMQSFGAYGAGGAAQNTLNGLGTLRYTSFEGGDETRPKNVAVIFCQYAGYDSSMAVGVATLASLSDVSVGGASNGDALVYDNGTWVPGAGGGGSDNLGNHTASETLVMGGNDITGAGTVSGTMGLFSGFSGFGGVTSPQAAVDATGGSVSATNIVVADGNAGSPAMFFANDGDTGIYRAGANTFGIATGGSINTLFGATNVSFTGGISVTGNVQATAYLHSSDARLKDNITTITSPTDILERLRGTHFNWKKDGAPSYGLIAQEVEKVLPELVPAGEGLKTVDYDQMVPILVEAVKAQQAQIDALRAEVEGLKQQGAP